MYVRPRLRVRPRNGGILAFSPASLFTSGVQGAWYDPSDYSTLFQDSAGTTPVTAVEQPVGLMLDKSQGLVLGSELITNGDFSGGSTGWSTVVTGGNAITISGGSVRFQTTGADTASLTQANVTAAGKWYRVEFDVLPGSTGNLKVTPFGGATGEIIFSCSPGRKVFNSFVVSATTFIISRVVGSVADATIDNISVKELPGNHASQATTASRPVLRARYNLLTYSQDYSNAAWQANAGTISANLPSAPDGTSTANLYTANAGLGYHYTNRSSAPVQTGTYTIAYSVKKGTSSWIFLTLVDSSINYFNFDTGTFGTTPDTCTATPTNNGWWRLTITKTITSQNVACGVGVANGNGGANFTAVGTESVYVWGADQRTGSSAGTYQRIAAATDYATAGFAPYLAFDGVDDFLGAAYVQSAYPLTITAGVDNTIGVVGTGIASVAQSDSSYKQLRDDATSVTASQDRNASTINPTVILVTGSKFCLSQFETSLVTHQVNGGTATTIANTNAFGTSANIFVGKTRPAGLFSSARDYGVVITNTVLTAAEKDSLKNYMGGKMGVTL